MTNPRIWNFAIGLLATTNVALLAILNVPAADSLWKRFLITVGSEPAINVANSQSDLFRVDKHVRTNGQTLIESGAVPFLVIVCSGKSDCPARQTEFASFVRLADSLSSRHQEVWVGSTIEDSVRVAFLADSMGLKVPMLVYDSTSAFSPEQVGISYMCMPFKVILNADFEPVYMRGADDTPESQEDFENAVLWLSKQYEADFVARTPL